MKAASMIVATLIFLAPSAALESQNKPTCDCTKRSAELVLEGGDSAPLKFYSLRNMLQPPNGNEPAWFCYERSVTNHSGADVPDVTWKVAAYEKDKIKPGRPVCDHSTVPGTSTNENVSWSTGPVIGGTPQQLLINLLLDGPRWLAKARRSLPLVNHCR